MPQLQPPAGYQFDNFAGESEVFNTGGIRPAAGLSFAGERWHRAAEALFQARHRGATPEELAPLVAEEKAAWAAAHQPPPPPVPPLRLTVAAVPCSIPPDPPPGLVRGAPAANSPAPKRMGRPPGRWEIDPDAPATRCHIRGCERDRKTRGCCPNHYQMIHRSGRLDHLLLAKNHNP